MSNNNWPDDDVPDLSDEGSWNPQEEQWPDARHAAAPQHGAPMPHHGHQAPQHAAPMPHHGHQQSALVANPQVVDSGKTMALVSHLSNLCGLPLFLLPMMSKDNAYALHHAKQAGTVYVANLLLLVLLLIATCITFGLVSPLFSAVPMIGLVAGVIGGLKAWEGEVYEFPYVAKYTERIFGNVQLNQLPPGR